MCVIFYYHIQVPYIHACKTRLEHERTPRDMNVNYKSREIWLCKLKVPTFTLGTYFTSIAISFYPQVQTMIAE